MHIYPERCLGERTEGSTSGPSDFDCSHQYASEITCEHCRFGPSKSGHDPRYPLTHKLNKNAKDTMNIKEGQLYLLKTKYTDDEPEMCNRVLYCIGKSELEGVKEVELEDSDGYVHTLQLKDAEKMLEPATAERLSELLEFRLAEIAKESTRRMQLCIKEYSKDLKRVGKKKGKA